MFLQKTRNLCRFYFFSVAKKGNPIKNGIIINNNRKIIMYYYMNKLINICISGAKILPQTPTYFGGSRVRCCCIKEKSGRFW